MWTQFWDMHSGGGTKESPYEKIYVEAEEDEAKVIFFNRFGHSPDRVTCTCCGEDYSVSSQETLEELTAFHRNKDGMGFGSKELSLEEYEAKEDVLIIRAEEIKDGERSGSVPVEGYVWQ